ncbi:serine/threonine-protein kinase 11-interacting protein isoform X3 [Procambarus clarkii]|uniref:serine/threonine-protein kinase 11-interacting protein isoform X3 n=1 Tax=Procambarus clarkii TaxID=6728 RepID=UPI003743A5B2
MDDAVLQRVCGLAAAFRQSAHLLLDQQYKLSLDTWSLGEIQEAFSLILEIEQHTNFHVLPPNHRQHSAIPHLQFIYDLLQKIFGLRLWAKDGHSLPQSETISLRCFRNLQALELLHIPIVSLKALQTLRPTLRSIVIVKGLNRLGDLFIRCGADKAGEFMWEQLQEAALAHNSLHSLDHSLGLLPNLKILDLSHCELDDASALEYLPTVSLLDISHNQLRLVPRLSPIATYSLTVLIANNNLFSHINGLHEMSNIEELDLRDNVLSMKEVLSPIGALPHLRVLKISGNPLTWDINYRSHTIRQLNPATANHQVIFDDQPLSSQECEEVGINAVSAGFSYPPELLSSLSSLASLCSPIDPVCPASGSLAHSLYSPQETDGLIVDLADSQPASLVNEPLSASVKSSGNGQLRRKSRKKRTRHVDITDPANENMDSDSMHMADSDLLERMGTPLTVSLLDDSVSKALTSHIFKTAMRTPAPEQSDRLLEEILQSKTQSRRPGAQSVNTGLVTTSENITHCDREMLDSKKENLPSNTLLDEIDKESIPEDNPSTSDITDVKTSNEPSMESSMESSFYKGSSNFSRRSSENTTPPQSDEDEKDDAHLVLAQREIEAARENTLKEGEDDTEGSTCQEDVILALTPLFFKEKHSITTRTLFRWELGCVESVELLSTSPHRILITFDTIRPAYKTRTYILDLPDYQSLMQNLTPVLERNALEKMLHSAMMCLTCDTQFSRDLAIQPNGSSTLKCPNCGGGVVVRVEKVDHPAVSSSAMYDKKDFLCSTPIKQTPVQKSRSSVGVHLPGTDSGSCLGESSESVSVCSEASSCVRRESDVEVISNPSVSSIEVLNDQHIIHDIILEEEGDEERAPVAAGVNMDVRTPANSPSIMQKQDAAPCMQESSSSGSMTGSVCTTYEKTGSLPTSPLKASINQHINIDTVDSKHNSKEISSDLSNTIYQKAESSLPVAMAGASPSSLGTSPHLSSSSASIDTIKNGVAFPALHHKAVMTSIQDDITFHENSTPRSISSWVQSLLHTLTGYYWLWWEEVTEVEGIDRISNPIRYSYEDFADVDHRLKLHCEVLLFHEPGEQLIGLVKAVLLVKGGRREFQGLLVISNKKVYILEIIAQEDDSPQTWLELCSSYKLSDVGTIHSLYQRQGLALSLADTVLLVSLADSHRANCFFNFFSEVLDEHGITPNIAECSPCQEEALTQLVSEAAKCARKETTPSIFAIVSLLLEGGCSESQFLAINEIDLVLFHASLEWYLPPKPESNLKVNLIQKISDITAVEVHSDSHICLQFMDEVTGAETSWDLHVASSVAACHIIQAIRTPWLQLFSVDLQDFIGVYRTKGGDLLGMTRVTDGTSTDNEKLAGGERFTQANNQDWCEVTEITRKLKYDPKYPILGYSDNVITPYDNEEKHALNTVDQLPANPDSSFDTVCEAAVTEHMVAQSCPYTPEFTLDTHKHDINNDKTDSSCVVSCNWQEAAPIFEENIGGECNVVFTQ